MMLITISLRRKVSRDQSRLSQLSDLFPEEDDIHVPRLPNKLRLIPHHLPAWNNGEKTFYFTPEIYIFRIDFTGKKMVELI